LVPSVAAIIGGGLSGLNAATLSGIDSPSSDILIFERSGRLGGRVLARHDEKGNIFPMGAWRYHGESAPLTSGLLRDLRIESAPWPFRLALVSIAGRTFEVDRRHWSETTDWGRLIYCGGSPAERRERFDRLWRNDTEHRLVVPASSMRKLIIASSGYNSLEALPLHCSRELFAMLPERNPEGWRVPIGGFERVVQQLIARLPARTHILNGFRLCDIDFESTQPRQYLLRFATPAGYRLFRADRVVLAIGGDELGKIGGSIGSLLRDIGSRVRSIAKFRAWLHYDDQIAARLRLADKSILVLDQAPRKLYFDGCNLMTYADVNDATLLARAAREDVEALVERVLAAIERVTLRPAPTFLRAPASVSWEYWPQGIQFLESESDANILTTLPPGLIVVNEAFSRHHGFIEGALDACRVQCSKLRPPAVA
jgi:hypothetical protein